MAKLKITFAIDRYDWLEPIRSGEVSAKDLDIEWITEGSKRRHDRMYHHREFDVCEFSMAGYLVARARGIDWMQAIPFFSRRMFAHHFCFVRADSGIRKPSDLRGRRIGIRTYENTLAVMTKGMFAHDYGLPVEDVTWVCVNNELVGTRPPPSIKVEQLAQGRKLEDMLLAGEIDATVEPALPQSWLAGDGKLVRLFPDFESEEREYFRRSRIFPIMHPIVIRKEMLDAHPWVARSLFDALCESRRRWRAFMQQPHRLSFAWAASYIEREESFFGGDPFVQGLRANRHDLRTMIGFCAEQGMLDGPLTVEELFPPSMQET
ncbi:MAG TPA: ABC transporter substrate-binding protein [Burkholderiales bacterium]|nr:ABC transporter substrate-binding protein [Burkholderiales bacterium]